MRYFVDTCVLSELTRKNPCPQVLAWFDAHEQEDDLYISTVTVGELQQGVAALSDTDPRKEQFAKWLEYRVLSEYAGRIAEYDVEAAKNWGNIMGMALRTGRPRPDLDTQIAAIALSHGMTMVTRNVDDFRFDGLTVINPFEKEVRS